jgi:hypothetical protein
MNYLATINTPGYLPMDDDPPIFETARAAWEYLRDERERAEDCADMSGGYSDGYAVLVELAADANVGPGAVYLTTPGRDPEDVHDLGEAYCVTETNEEMAA